MNCWIPKFYIFGDLLDRFDWTLQAPAFWNLGGCKAGRRALNLKVLIEMKQLKNPRNSRLHDQEDPNRVMYSIC